MLYPFTFKVTYYNADLQKSVQDCGVFFATDYAQAAGILEDYYGNDFVGIDHLYALEESPIILLNAEVLDNIEMDKYYMVGARAE